MAVHELTTNAAKHGSLSVPQGRIHVSWNVGSDAGSRFIELRWAEVDGPYVGKPTRTGFGSMLLERVLTRQLQGQVQVDYAPSGLCVVIKAPLPDKPAHNLDS
jgi:two-component sensor histidine kinase